MALFLSGCQRVYRGVGPYSGPGPSRAPRGAHSQNKDKRPDRPPGLAGRALAPRAKVTSSASGLRAMRDGAAAGGTWSSKDIGPTGLVNGDARLP